MVDVPLPFPFSVSLSPIDSNSSMFVPSLSPLSPLLPSGAFPVADNVAAVLSVVATKRES